MIPRRLGRQLPRSITFPDRALRPWCSVPVACSYCDGYGKATVSPVPIIPVLGPNAMAVSLEMAYLSRPLLATIRSPIFATAIAAFLTGYHIAWWMKGPSPDLRADLLPRPCSCPLFDEGSDQIRAMVDLGAAIRGLVTFDDGAPRWGTLARCPTCRGYTGVSTRGAEVPGTAHGWVYDPVVATIVALFAHGYNVAGWESDETSTLNRFDVPVPCACRTKD